MGLVDSSLHGAVVNAVPHAIGLGLILLGLFLPIRFFSAVCLDEAADPPSVKVTLSGHPGVSSMQ